MKTQQGVLLGKCSPSTADLTLEHGVESVSSQCNTPRKLSQTCHVVFVIT